jgi:hypothetical protein
MTATISGSSSGSTSGTAATNAGTTGNLPSGQSALQAGTKLTLNGDLRIFAGRSAHHLAERVCSHLKIGLGHSPPVSP